MTCFVGRVFGFKPIQSPLASCKATEPGEDEIFTSDMFDDSFDQDGQNRLNCTDSYSETCSNCQENSYDIDQPTPLPLDGRQRTDEMIDFSSMLRETTIPQALEISENVCDDDDDDDDQAISISESESSSPISTMSQYGDEVFPALPTRSSKDTIDEGSEHHQDYSPSLALRESTDGPSLGIPDLVAPVGVTSDNIEYQRDHLQNLGDQMEKAGRLSEALQFYEMCQELDEALQVSVIDSVTVHLKIGIVYWKTGAYQQSMDSLSCVLSLYADTLGPSWLEQVSTTRSNVDGMVLAETFLTLGRVNLSLGDTSKARKELRRGLEVVKDFHLGDEVAYPIIARGLHCVGMTYETEDRNSKALEYCQEALAIQQDLYGGCHVDIAACLASIGSLREKTGDVSGAMKCFVKALSLYELLLTEGASQADVGVMLSKIGWICFLENHDESAMEAYEEAIDIFSKFLGERHRNVASVLVQIGMVHDKCGRHQKAACSYKKALVLQRQALGDIHGDIAITLSAIAACYEALGCLAKAISYYDKALHIHRTLHGKRHINVGETFSYLGNLYTKAKQYHLARQCYSNALKILTRNRVPAGDDRLRLISESLQQLSHVKQDD